MRRSKEKQPNPDNPAAGDTIGIPIVSRRAVLIGLAGAVLLMNWSVCEQDDQLCAFTGAPGK